MKFYFVIFVYESSLIHTIQCEILIFHADLNEVKLK